MAAASPVASLGPSSSSASAELRLMQQRHSALLRAVQGTILGQLLEAAREAFAFWHWVVAVHPMPSLT